MSSLGAELPRMMVRAARLLPAHGASGNVGAVEGILAVLASAAEAIATQDVVAYVRSHEELKAVIA